MVQNELGLRAPPALESGSRVIAVAPASPFDRETFERGLGRLRARYEVSHRADLFERTGFLAGDDERRLSELQAAIDDDSVAAIVAARGGYGCTRLLDRLDMTGLERRPKLLVGFSDITALHALWAKHNVRSIHGPMIASLGKHGEGNHDDAALDRLSRVLEGDAPAVFDNLVCERDGRAQGRLLGGNLTVLTALIGTPFMPSFRGAVLFLEDIGERPYRVDRMLTTWRQSGALDGVVAVVLGAFTDCEPGVDGVCVDDVLRSHLRALNVPVVSGLLAGHIDDNHPLAFGALVDVDATQGSLRSLGGACVRK